jgi:hypothetical protein
VLSYPKESTARTCYASEPWHFRYVGRELAANIQASGLTLREYLWANFTTTVVPQPTTSSGPTIAPLPTAGPTPSSRTLPDPSPTALAAPPTATAIARTATADPTAIPSDATDPIDPAVAAGAQPALVLIAGITFTLIIGGGWLAARRRRPGRGQ